MGMEKAKITGSSAIFKIRRLFFMERGNKSRESGLKDPESGTGGGSRLLLKEGL